MNRRSFFGFLAAAFTLVSVGLGGCSFESVFAQIAAYVPIGLSAVAGIVALIPGLSLLSPILLAAKAAFADLDSIVTEYENAASADKTTLLGKVSTAISAVIDNLQQLLASVDVPSGVSSLVQGFAGLILGTLQAFAAALPSAAPVTSARAASIRIGQAGPMIAITPKRRSVKEFRKEYNALATAGGHPELVIP